MVPAGTWQRFAPPPSVADIQKILQKHNRRMAEHGQPYLLRKSDEPTFHQEILDVLLDERDHDLTTEFRVNLRFGPARQVSTKIKMIARRGDATGEWVVQRNGNFVRLRRLQ
jgi:hypothetical protein